MTAREMQSSFEIEASRFDSDIMLESHVIFYWLNEAQERIFKTRYSGLNSKQQGYEQTQKRKDDLRTLTKEVYLLTGQGVLGDKPFSYHVTLPNDYAFTVGEEAEIIFTSNGTPYAKRVGVYPITSDEYAKEISNPFGKHKLHYEDATPLSLMKEDVVELISDGNYDITIYYLRYIKIPSTISLDGGDCELPEHIHAEIVSTAVNLLLESLSDPRYESTKREIQEQE